jgi:hypothetical protein
MTQTKQRMLGWNAMYQQRCFRFSWLLSIGLAWVEMVGAQEPPASSQAHPPPAQQVLEEKTSKNLVAPCMEPPPLVSLKDYNGPLNKVVGIFARALERKSVHPPHYKPGVVLCSLELKDKFSVCPGLVGPGDISECCLLGGYGPSFEHRSNVRARRRGLWQALRGEPRRSGAYSSIFSEDPRYYRLAHGSVRKRFLHAAGHVFVAHREDGKHMPNYSEWPGTVSAVTLSNAYHPDNERGVGPAGRRVGCSLIQDMGFDVLREFWPEISRKLKLRFRDEHEVEISAGAVPPR